MKTKESNASKDSHAVAIPNHMYIMLRDPKDEVCITHVFHCRSPSMSVFKSHVTYAPRAEPTLLLISPHDNQQLQSGMLYAVPLATTIRPIMTVRRQMQ
jgi:hypothetical protein